MKYEVQDIITIHGAEFVCNHATTSQQRQVLRDLRVCRTHELGSHVDTCDLCGYQKISFNSCRNRHCPKCQTMKKEQWLEMQKQYLLNVPYFHVVFTVPSKLNPVFLQNPEACYNLLFRAASETILELSSDPKYLGARPGMTAILHTWGQNLLFHPHIHCVVTGGGLNKLNRWVNSKKKFFLPVRVLAKKFRGKFLAYIKELDLKFYGKYAEYNNAAVFDRSLISPLYKKQWVVYCKPPFAGAQQVYSYLGRYTHRVAISNNRILNVADGLVTFLWKDYKDNNRNKKMTISASEFIRRFLLHVLPKGFRKIRHYGVLAARGKVARIALCKQLTRTTQRYSPLSTRDILFKMFGDSYEVCPCCRIGHLTRASPNSLITA